MEKLKSISKLSQKHWHYYNKWRLRIENYALVTKKFFHAQKRGIFYCKIILCVCVQDVLQNQQIMHCVQNHLTLVRLALGLVIQP